jgi:dihydrodipicolinate synthase/N-acetylneuraminate lyase
MRMLNRQNFIGPWAGLPVTWTEDDKFDEPTYREDVERCCRAGVPGVYTGGTSGEFYAQEWSDFERVTSATIEVCHAHGKPAMIGCTATSTRGARRRAAFAAQVGADAIQVALPFWMEVADDQVLPFFAAAVEASDGLPLSIYETRRAKKVLTLDQHREIHGALPQYTMVKSNNGTIGDTTEGCRELSYFVNVFVGEHRWAELGPHGARGGCSSLIYWAPAAVLRSWKRMRDRQWSELQADCRQIESLFQALFATFGSRGFTDSAYDRLGGLASGFLRTSLRCQPPYPSPNEDDLEKMRELLRRHVPEFLENTSFSASPV